MCISYPGGRDVHQLPGGRDVHQLSWRQGCASAILAAGMCISYTGGRDVHQRHLCPALHFKPKIRPPPPPSVRQCRDAALPPLQWPPPPTLPYLLSPSHHHSYLPTYSSQLTHLPPTARPSLLALSPSSYMTDALHRTLPQHTPLR